MVPYLYPHRDEQSGVAMNQHRIFNPVSCPRKFFRVKFPSEFPSAAYLKLKKKHILCYKGYLMGELAQGKSLRL